MGLSVAEDIEAFIANEKSLSERQGRLTGMGYVKKEIIRTIARLRSNGTKGKTYAEALDEIREIFSRTQQAEGEPGEIKKL